MNPTTVQMDQKEEEILSFQVSDEVLESVAATEMGHALHVRPMHRPTGLPWPPAHGMNRFPAHFRRLVRHQLTRTRLCHGHDTNAAAQIDLLDHEVGLARTRGGPDLGDCRLPLLLVDRLRAVAAAAHQP
jgi:hypothetical protein